MKYVYNDGGRAAAGFTGSANDCVTRAIALVSGKPYAEVWQAMAAGNKSDGKRFSADHCVRTYNRWFYDYMTANGFTWVEPKKKTYVRDLLKGNYVVAIRGHYFAVLGDTIYDTHPVSDNKVVRGYWLYKAPKVTTTAATYNVFKGATQLNRYPLNFLQAVTMRGLYALNYGGDPEIKPC